MKTGIACVAVVVGLFMPTLAQTPTGVEKPKRTLGVVGTAHLDTQWRWTIKNTIEEYIPATFRENEKLFQKYPDYVFSFEGAFRYMLLKEYYPEEYKRLKQYVADGRWRVCGSWVDAADVNIPSFESLVRQTLYGNGYFKEEFGKTSTDIFMPDCFGFGYALPSIAHHCGLKSFSTQKLTWGSSVGVPFDIGLWEGVDGSTIVAALNPGDYVSKVRGDLSSDTMWLRKIEEQAAKSNLPSAYHYIGTGDVGGSPDSQSVRWLEQSMKSDGPITVTSIAADDLASLGVYDSGVNLPRYKGELLMTRHGVGCYTSQAAMKRWNRKNELLADATERASVIASLYAGAKYPGDDLKQTWIRFLWHQFHDDLTGTSIPEAYEYSWNDELLCQNRFASMLTDAVSNIAPMLDTRTKGIPLIVFNPVSVARQDVMTVEVPEGVKQVRVVGPDGKEAPSYLLKDAMGSGRNQQIAFLASAPSVGYAVYDLQVGEVSKLKAGELTATNRSLENARYAVKINDDGNVSSIYDKVSAKELLAAPIEYQFLFDKPDRWPAWEIQYKDIATPPVERFVGAPEIEMIDQRPVRVGLEINRMTEKSKFHLVVWLAASEAGNRIEFENVIDWYEKETLLKAAFPFASANDSVTYDLGLGTIKRGLNTEKKYEVPGHQWADMTAPDSSYGAAVLSDCKYGWDHPDANTLRLSLIHTPGVFENWNWVGDQSSQDMGRHLFKFAICGHKGDWRDGNVVVEAARLNQPLLGFQAPSQDKGNLGKSNSLVSIGSSTDARKSEPAPAVVATAVKIAEHSNELVIRVRETAGRQTENVSIKLAMPVISAREVNGMEDSVGAATITKGVLVTSFTPYQPKAFAVTVANKPAVADKLKYEPLKLDYNLDGISMDDDRKDGDLDGHGNTLAGELLPDTVWFQGIPFVIGPKSTGQKNVVACDGQSLGKGGAELKPSSLYLLAVATNGGTSGAFVFDTKDPRVLMSSRSDDHMRIFPVPDYRENVGQWNNRMVNGAMVESPALIKPENISPTPVAWYGSHYHNAKGDNVTYKYTYAYMLELPAEYPIILPNNFNLEILAATIVRKNPYVIPAQPLHDVAEAAIARISTEKTVFIDSTLVAMSSPNVGAEIRYTLDGTAPSQNSSKYDKPVVVADSRTIKARAFLTGVNSDYISSLSFTKLVTHEPVTIAGAIPGLTCKYYEGEWNKMPNFDSLKVVKDTVTDTIAIPPYAKDSLFGLVLSGYIRIPTEGLYQFGLSSDDGSILWIGDSLVVDNDGLHGSGEVNGQIALKAGLHPLTVRMFQCKGDEALDLSIGGPGLPKQAVSRSMLVRQMSAKSKGGTKRH
jgi:alpha-mannosidase